VLLAGVLLSAMVTPEALVGAQGNGSGGMLSDPPVLDSTVAFARNQSDLRVAVDRYALDRAALIRRYDIENSPALRERLRRFYLDWAARLEQLDFDALNHEGRIDYILLRNRITFEQAMLTEQDRAVTQMMALIPYAASIYELQERRRDREPIEARSAAEALADLAQAADSLAAVLRANPPSNGLATIPGVTPVVAFRTANHLESLRATLAHWYRFYAGYDPVFTWWAEQPYTRADSAIARHIDAIREEVVGIRGDGIDPIIGDPIGEAGLRAHLAHEMIFYTAEELLAISRRPVRRVHRCAQRNHVSAPRRRSLADGNDVAAGPAHQSVLPGGETITISYPTNTMTHEEKLMSMRGNNPHFNRATVHHELIPGHHLQGFMTDRFNAHRNVFNTPFWREGWALYWELQLWDQGFPRGPEDRIGMLFWRMHRAARIIFSLSFHLGRMTPQEAVDFLVDRVGHERANAEAEVRRSFQSTYSPLYQAAYMLGGMQFRALHDELVTNGRMSEREFHDAVLRAGVMPVELVRASLTDRPIERNHATGWRFMGDPLPARR
jgi:hypothetical protein